MQATARLEGRRTWGAVAARAVAAAVLATVAVGFWMRLDAFSTEELGLDGHLSVGLASVPVADMLAFNLRDVHPPLFYLLMRAWLGLVGTNFVAAKWLVIACSVLSIPLLYQIARSLLGPPAGLLAALLLMASPAHVFLSATVRDFVPGLLLSLLSLSLILVMADGRAAGGRGPWLLGLGLALTTGAALLVWYFHLIYLGLQVLYLAVRRSRAWHLVGGALLAGLVIAAPWYALALPSLLGKAAGGVTVSGSAPEALELAAFGREAAAQLVGVAPLPWQVALAFWGLLFVLGAVAGWRTGRSRPVIILSLVGSTVGLLAAYALAGRWVHSTFIHRYFLVPLPFILMIQAGLMAGRTVIWRLVGGLGAMAMLAAGVASWQPLATSEGIPYKADPVMLYLEERVEPGDGILFMDIARLGLYRLRNPASVPTYAIHFAGSSFLAEDVPQRVASLVPQIQATHKRVWFVNSELDKKPFSQIIEKALGQPLSPPVVRQNRFSYGEIFLFPGRLR